MRFMIHIKQSEKSWYEVIDADISPELMYCLFCLDRLEGMYLVQVDVSSEKDDAGIWVQVAHTYNNSGKWKNTEKIDEKQLHDPEYIDQLVGAIWERALSTRELYKSFRSSSMEKFILEE